MRTYNIDRIKKKLSNGEVVIGSHVFSGLPMLAEAIALAGFDMIWIDMEHTAIEKKDVLNCLIAVQAGEACSLVRIPWNDPVLAKPILDMGPDALLFPYIRNADDAKRAVSACNYPPKGVRGYGPQRALEYGRILPNDYVNELYRNTWRMVQIECISAVRELDAILDVDGIDAFIIGPNDLAGSVGKIGQPNAPEMMEIYDEIANKISSAGKIFGVSMGYDPTVFQQWLDRGAKLLFCGYDIGYAYEGAAQIRERMLSQIDYTGRSDS